MNQPHVGATPSKPWYRHPWALFLAALPAIAVVAGVITFRIAANGTDGLVAEDYYKQGLNVQEDIKRLHHARERGIQGVLSLKAEGVAFTPERADALNNPSLLLRFVHPTRAGLDQVVALKNDSGVYRGQMPNIVMGAWKFQLEDEAQTWRIVGAAHLPELLPIAMSGKDSL